MTPISASKSGGSQERILAAAVALFAKLGYHGASTRDVALAAKVNEVTIYRHYPKKRDLFIAALESELQKLTFSADAISKLGDSTDLHSGFQLIFQLVSDALGRQPNLVRLLQFSALEIGPDLEPLYRKYLGVLLQISGNYLDRCQDKGDPKADPYMAAIVLAGAAVSHYGFYQLLPNPTSASLSNSEAAAMFSNLILNRAQVSFDPS